MSRRSRVFFRTNHQQIQLTQTPWAHDSCVSITAEHWDVLLAAAGSVDQQLAQTLTQISKTPADADLKVLMRTKQLSDLVDRLQQLQTQILDLPLATPKPYFEDQGQTEVFETSEYAKMIASLVELLQQVIKFDAQLESWRE